MQAVYGCERISSKQRELQIGNQMISHILAQSLSSSDSTSPFVFCSGHGFLLSATTDTNAGHSHFMGASAQNNASDKSVK
jgi:hypothetical protein